MLCKIGGLLGLCLEALPKGLAGCSLLLCLVRLCSECTQCG